jgi:hypothetical protein
MVVSLKRLLTLSFILLLPSTAAATDYQQLESKHFIILFTHDDAKIAADLPLEAEKIREKIVSDIGYGFTEKTVTVLAPTVEDFQNVQPDKIWIPLWATGVAYPSRNLIIIRSPRSVKGRHIDVLKVFTHELSHIMIGSVLIGKTIPAWLNEGLAMYEAREWTFFSITSLVRAVLTDRLIPLRILTRSFPGDENLVELAYTESFIFISYLINKIGREAFHRFIQDFSRNGDLEGSLRRATGMPLITLEKDWIKYLKIRISWVPILTSATALWFIVSLIFLYGYFRKKSLAMEKMKRWEDEDKELNGI